MIDHLSDIIQNFQFTKTYKDKNAQTIQIQLQFSNPQIKDTNKLTTELLQSRSQHYVFYIYFDVDYLFKEKENKIQKIETKQKFYVTVPVLTGCKQDPQLKLKTDQERWQNGIDLNPTNCDIILDGIQYFVQNTFSYPANKPTIVQTDKDNLIVVAQYLKQDNVMFGNTYYSRIGLWQNPKDQDQMMFVLVFKQYDSRFVNQQFIPIKWLFYLYGVQNDTQILDMCDGEFRQFLLQTYRVNIANLLGEDYDETSQLFFKKLQNIKQLLLELLAGNQSTEIKDVDDAMEKYISKYSNSKQFIYQILEFIKSIWYAWKYDAYTDRDHMANKRVQTIGLQYISQLRSCLQQAWKTHIISIVNSAKEISFINVQQLQNIVNEQTDMMSKTLQNNIIKSISSSSDEVLTPLQKSLNEHQTRSCEQLQKRQIVLRLDSMGGKITYQQRKVQQSFYGFMCPITTPEGQVGRYISPTLYTSFSSICEIDEYLEFLKKQKYFQESIPKKSYIPVKINYIIYGFVQYENVKELYKDLMVFRQKNEKLWETSVYFQIENEQRNPISELGILTDVGRLITIVYKKISKDNEFDLKTSVNDKFKSGELFWMCPEMSQNFIVNEWQLQDKSVQKLDNQYLQPKQMKDIITGKNVEYYFLPYGLVGEIPSICPFVQTLKSIRQSYMTNQMRANITSMYTNFQNMLTNMMNVLTRQQYNAIHTTVERQYKPFKEHPMMQLLYVMFKQEVYNQDDALIANSGYFNRGGAQSSQYITYYTSLEDETEYFPSQKQLKFGQQIRNDQVLIFKSKKDDFGNIKDLSIRCTQVVNMFNVVSNIKMFDKDGKVVYNTRDAFEVFVRVMSHRKSNQGDKFISRNAQKGTIGQIRKEWEIDIFINGIIPNFIFSTTNAVMKRETYGQIAEPCLNLLLCQKQQYTLNIGMDERQQDIISQIATIQPQQAISARSGELLLQSSILSGPMSYGVQKHLVDQKLYARDIGPISKNTRQALKGRKRAGGMNHGNLEQEAHLSAGAMNYLQDINGTNSLWYICPHCGHGCVYKQNDKEYYCQLCGPLQTSLEMGNSFMIPLLQEVLYGSGIGIVFDVNKLKFQKK